MQSKTQNPRSRIEPPRTSPYPLLFNPILKPKVWGGRWLANLGKKLPPDELIGESWELADLPESIEAARSLIANGTMQGRTLHDLLIDDARTIMGDGHLTAEGGFPLLLKYLDAQQNLSVQVHPDERYAASHPGAHLKSEAWVVIHAEPGAVIYNGLKPRVTREKFAEHIRSGEVVDDLMTFPALPGECHYLPSGTCHALGAGVVVAEIQTPSDTTFRVFDWGRDGAGRELHIEQALQCIHFGEPSPRRQLPPTIEARGSRATPLVETDYFSVERIETDRQLPELTLETSGLPMIFMMLAGRAEILSAQSDQAATLLTPGITALIPAALGTIPIVFHEPTTMLRVQLPSQLRGMVA